MDKLLDKNNKVMVIDTKEKQHMCLEVLTVYEDGCRGELVVVGYDLLTGTYETVLMSQIVNAEAIDVNF